MWWNKAPWKHEHVWNAVRKLGDALTKNSAETIAGMHTITNETKTAQILLETLTTGCERITESWRVFN